CCGAPPLEATAAYTPPCSTRITGFLRSLPELAPSDVITTTGTPRNVAPLVPPDVSYSWTCSRTHFAWLGSYSPCSGIVSPCAGGFRSLEPVGCADGACPQTVHPHLPPAGDRRDPPLGPADRVLDLRERTRSIRRGGTTDRP